MDLIDREQLKSTIRKMVEIPNETRAQVIGAINRAKAIDIVRCKDCKHFKDWGDGNKTCYLWTDQRDMPTVDDAFCSYGERRTDNA